MVLRLTGAPRVGGDAAPSSRQPQSPAQGLAHAQTGHKSPHEGVELHPGPHRAEPAQPMAPPPSTCPAPRLTPGQGEGKLPSVGLGRQEGAGWR